MTYEINRLEEAWLKAESDADMVKREAMQIDQVLANHDDCEDVQDDYDVLITKAEQLRAQLLKADQEAAEAFERFWSAKGMNGTNA